MMGAAAGSVQFSRSIGAALGTSIVSAILFISLSHANPETAALFGTLVELKSAAADAREPVEGKLKEKLNGFVDNYFTERQTRLDQFKDIVKREEDSLRRDRERRDELMERQRKSFQEEIDRADKIDDAAPSSQPQPTPAPTTQP